MRLKIPLASVRVRVPRGRVLEGDRNAGIAIDLRDAAAADRAIEAITRTRRAGPLPRLLALHRFPAAGALYSFAL
jgi:hypothetical protein